MTVQQLVPEPATTPPRPRAARPARRAAVRGRRTARGRRSGTRGPPRPRAGDERWIRRRQRRLVVFADADGMTKAGSSYDGPRRVAPARSVARPPMPHGPRGPPQRAAAHATTDGPRGRRACAPGADDADLVKKRPRRPARRRRPRRRRGGARARPARLGRQARTRRVRLRAAPRPSPSGAWPRARRRATGRRAPGGRHVARARCGPRRHGKPPKSPAVATMFNDAASRREEVKATIEAALKEDRAPLNDDRPPPPEAAPPPPPPPSPRRR